MLHESDLVTARRCRYKVQRASFSVEAASRASLHLQRWCAGKADSELNVRYLHSETLRLQPLRNTGSPKLGGFNKAPLNVFRSYLLLYGKEKHAQNSTARPGICAEVCHCRNGRVRYQRAARPSGRVLKGLRRACGCFDWRVMRYGSKSTKMKNPRSL